VGDLALDLDGVQHRVLGPPVLGQRNPEQHRGQQQGQQRDGHHDQALGPQRQVGPGPAPQSFAHVTEMSERAWPT